MTSRATHRPTAPAGLTASGGPQVALSWAAATDNVGVARYNVHRGTGPGFTPSTANRVAQPTGTSFTNTGLASGPVLPRHRGGRAGTLAPLERGERHRDEPASAGLVAGYGFDEGSGTSTADGSGRGNTGTLFGRRGPSASSATLATSTASTTGSPSPDSSSLDLTTGMTLEAWVLPSTNLGWRTIVFKEQTKTSLTRCTHRRIRTCPAARQCSAVQPGR